jgi:4,5-DOPA dioxygenase extradiol
VFQVSLDQAKAFSEHVALSRELQALRARGILLLASGNLVHNLHRINWEMVDAGYDWAQEFDAKVARALVDRDLAALTSPDYWGSKLLGEAHPTLEHYAPLLYCLGSSDERDQITFPYEGLEFGSISMRMVLFASAAAA